MNARRLNIGIRSSAERSKALRDAMRRIDRGDHAAQEPELYFENVEELRRILTEKRLERKCCNFENGDGGHHENNWAARSQAARSNSWSMN